MTDYTHHRTPREMTAAHLSLRLQMTDWTVSPVTPGGSLRHGQKSRIVLPRETSVKRALPVGVASMMLPRPPPI